MELQDHAQLRGVLEDLVELDDVRVVHHLRDRQLGLQTVEPREFREPGALRFSAQLLRKLCGELRRLPFYPVKTANKYGGVIIAEICGDDEFTPKLRINNTNPGS